MKLSCALVFCILLLRDISPVLGSLPPQVQISYSQPGDFILGGLFSMYFSFSDVCDYGVLTDGLQQSELMIFAIKQINNRTDLLPNVTLGFDIRDYCGSESFVASVALSMAGVIETTAGSASGPSDRGQFVGIVGAGGSASNIATALVTTVYEIPTVAYRGSTTELSDKHRFPYFLRTWPSANLQAGAIVDILLEFNWSYVGLIYSVNSYGIHGAQEVQSLAERNGICLAYSLPIRESATENEIREIVDKILKFKKASVIVFFSHMYSLDDYKILEVLFQNAPDHSGLRLISSDAFGDVSNLVKSGVANLTSGSFSIRNYYQEVPEFLDYFRDVQADGRPLSPWFQTMIESCKKNNRCPVTTTGDRYHVVDAVYAFATALHEILQEDCDGDFACLINGTVTGAALVSHLKGVKFDGVDGVFQFDANSDAVGKYAVHSVQYLDGGYLSVGVGDWDSRGTMGDRLHIRPGSLKWPNEAATPPRSICREDCRPGYTIVPLEDKCCYGCQRCSENAIVVNDTNCVECDRFQWPAENFLVCEMITASPVDWQNAAIIAILILSSVGVVLSVLAIAGIIYYRQHALIKATSRELSCVNVAGLFVTFLSVVLILAYPTRATCFVSEMMIALCLTLTYAPTLLKVNRIYRIFKAGKKSKKRPRFVGPREQLIIASILTAVPLLIGIFSVIWAPSLPRFYQQSKLENYMEIFCEFGGGFLASCVYNLLLILVCCYYAFKTRKVPSNYNESKFIAVSVYSTLVLCLAAIPVYTTAVAVLQKVATLCMALLLNAYLTLICVYLTKLYAVRFVQDLEVSDWRTATGESGPSHAGTSSSISGPRHTRVHPVSSTVATNVDHL